MCFFGDFERGGWKLYWCARCEQSIVSQRGARRCNAAELGAAGGRFGLDHWWANVSFALIQVVRVQCALCVRVRVCACVCVPMLGYHG